jgi:uncharacterized membrane protein
MKYLLFGAAVLHAFFLFSELLPWPSPLLLQTVGKKLSTSEPFTPNQQKLVATLVHNAAIYNGIVAGGLLWAACGGYSANGVARVMFAGAAVAGVFGTATLKAPLAVALTVAQAAVGIIGLFLV